MQIQQPQQHILIQSPQHHHQQGQLVATANGGTVFLNAMGSAIGQQQQQQGNNTNSTGQAKAEKSSP